MSHGVTSEYARNREFLLRGLTSCRKPPSEDANTPQINSQQKEKRSNSHKEVPSTQNRRLFLLGGGGGVGDSFNQKWLLFFFFFFVGGGGVGLRRFLQLQMGGSF